jgi:hypothetical protein
LRIVKIFDDKYKTGTIKIKYKMGKPRDIFGRLKFATDNFWHHIVFDSFNNFDLERVLIGYNVTQNTGGISAVFDSNKIVITTSSPPSQYAYIQIFVTEFTL